MAQQVTSVETPKMDGFAAIVVKDISQLFTEMDAPVRLPKTHSIMCILGDVQSNTIKKES